MFRRNISQAIDAALRDTRVVLLAGPRQVGKTTLATRVAEERGGRYLRLDDASTLAAATSDPSGFIAGVSTVGARSSVPITVIDEVQKAPDLLLRIKMDVDTD